jgi:predicted acyl esterase
MKKLILLLLMFVNISNIFSQNATIPIPGSIDLSERDDVKNGTLDQLYDFAQRIQVPFTMPDGIKLQTDVYIPILQDSLTFEFEIPIINKAIKLKVLPRGVQYIRYDSINGMANPNPYQLPAIMSRTPYNKRDPQQGSAMALLGYLGLFQDMRGRYASDGVYLPLYSDSWDKNAYHPNYGHVLDLLPLSHPQNGNKHEDGKNTMKFLNEKLVRTYDLDGDGIQETVANPYNGSVGMFGASALAYNQIQAASSFMQDQNAPGLKCLFPIVGPGEFYKSTGFQNGVFRDMLVTGWLRGQIRDTEDEKMDIDFDLQNDIHTSKDYGTRDKFEASNKAIDHFSVVRYNNGPAGYYPNSIGRRDMDMSRAPLNSEGESDINGTVSRYTNMEVPTFHVAGWYDIFVDGSIETFNLQKHYIDPLKGNKKKIKLIMGPWAHQTISSTESGDMVYPDNVKELTKIDISDFGDNLDLGEIARSELIGWFRYNLNRNSFAKVGEPTIAFPEAKTFQQVLPGIRVKFPAEDFTFRHVDLINFLMATDGLKQVPIAIRIGSGPVISFKLDVPALPEPIIDGVSSNTKLDSLPVPNFEETPPMRLYIIGPVNDGIPGNETAGSYWMAADTFPIKDNITWSSIYLHQNGKLDFNPHTTNEGMATYVHDPDNPVITCGGANMLVETPQGDRSSQGQMNFADPNFRNYSMDRPGVLQFTTDTLTDSLCIVGFPKGLLYAKTNPGIELDGKPTDSDFFMKILDCYPDGRQFFVVQGAMNARAREWNRLYANGIEDDNAPYSNIETGKLYEYLFQFMPIGYTFGKGHRIKVLITSSDFPRYQSNANVPINDGEFFRRKPGDGRTYVFQGVEYAPRKSVQRIAFSPEFPTQIILPVYGKSTLTAVKPQIKVDWDIDVYPNPSSDLVNINLSKNGNYIYEVFNTLGDKIAENSFEQNEKIDISSWQSGQYFITIYDKNNDKARMSKSFTKI